MLQHPTALKSEVWKVRPWLHGSQLCTMRAVAVCLHDVAKDCALLYSGGPGQSSGCIATPAGSQLLRASSPVQEANQAAGAATAAAAGQRRTLGQPLRPACL